MTVLLGALFLFTPPTALGARLKPAAISASSTYPAEAGVNYEAKLVGDGKLGTSWVEGEEGGGLGSWFELDLGEVKNVQKVKIWGGFWFSWDFWNRANRPKEIELRFDDGTSEKHTLKDEMLAQEVVLKQSKKTQKVQVRIKAIYSGTTWLDTAISEFQVFDDASDKGLAVAKYVVSSKLEDDADGNYSPENVADGIKDSLWCEGNKEGDGTGEWLEFDFGGAKSVSKLTMINGIGSSLPIWFKGNRVTKAALTFSNGSTQDITIKNSMMPQTISFSPQQTSSVRVVFTAVAKGKEFNDLCITEAYFSP